jgi:hypothetical protein
MQDIFFTNSNEAPVPREEVRIRELEAVPRPDGVRVELSTALTPFLERPNLEVSIRNAVGDEVATLSVVEAVDPKMDFTMHLREQQPGGEYTLAMRVFYADIEGNQPAEGEGRAAGEILQGASQVVDERQVRFTIDN